MTYECYCDYDPATVSAFRWVKRSRKAHRCTECYKPILPGEPARVATWLYDGHWTTERRCARCQSLAEWCRVTVPCFCDMWGSLHQDAREMAAEVQREVPGVWMEYGRRILRCIKPDRWPLAYPARRPEDQPPC